MVKTLHIPGDHFVLEKKILKVFFYIVYGHDVCLSHVTTLIQANFHFPNSYTFFINYFNRLSRISEAVEIWVTLDKGQTMTLNSGTQKTNHVLL